VNDRDWVVVGATPEEMIDAGYLPVGKDFPVFLHPETREEYALARTERKTGRGYHGFAFHAAPDVTLEQDLARRDLTINAMAQDDDGPLIDPFDGQQRPAGARAAPRHRCLPRRPGAHPARGALRRPLRRLFLAPETLALMRAMVEDGEVDHLVPERVWQELARGLMEPKPSRMFEVLRDCGALARCCPRWTACGACRSAPTTTRKSTPACT
jgi:tRNA nucleotidyltransferase (CCA-adding enzyme)